MSLSPRRKIVTACRIEVEHSNESLHAHVELENAPPIRPGDRVRVHGPAITVPFGAKLVERRTATIERAGWLEQQWTKLTARFALTELYEVSFSPGRTP